MHKISAKRVSDLVNKKSTRRKAEEAEEERGKKKRGTTEARRAGALTLLTRISIFISRFRSFLCFYGWDYIFSSKLRRKTEKTE